MKNSIKVSNQKTQKNFHIRKRTIKMGLGMSLGLALGAASGNIAIGLVGGLVIGCLGIVFGNLSRWKTNRREDKDDSYSPI